MTIFVFYIPWVIRKTSGRINKQPRVLSTVYRRVFSGRGFSDLGQVQGQSQDQGQGQDQKWRQRSALQQQMVLALTLTLVLVLTLALAPSGMISKKGVPAFCPSTVVVAVVIMIQVLIFFL